MIKITIKCNQLIFPLETKAINVPGPIIRAQVFPFLKKYSPKTLQENLRIFQSQKSKVLSQLNNDMMLLKSTSKRICMRPV